MNKLIKVLIFTLYPIFLIQGQNVNDSEIEIKYEMKLIQDSTNKENVKKAEMILLINKEKSYYFNPEMVKFYQHLDNQIKTFTNIQDIAKNFIPVPKVRQSVWNENNVITITSPLGKYNYSYTANKIEWKLLTGSKKIGNLTCNLAQATIDDTVFYAWYTVDIPFNDGPFKFKGLPGLILEVYNTNHTIEISAYSIETKRIKIDRMIEPLNVTLKNRTEFLLAREKYFKYPFDNNFSKEIVQRKMEQLKKINVFLD